MGRSVIAKGIRAETRKFDNEYKKFHNATCRALVRVIEDLLRKSQDNAPLQEGTLAASGSTWVDDNGPGRDIVGGVGFDTPYARRRHEDRYHAQPRKPKHTGRMFFRATPTGNARGGTDISAGTPSSYGLYGKRGTKYITRTWWSNRRRYREALRRAGKKMNIEKVRYFVAAVTGLNVSLVQYGNQADTPDALVTVQNMGPPDAHQHETVMIPKYIAIVRSDPVLTIGNEEAAYAIAWALFQAVRESNSLNSYYGIKLTAAMDDETDPITFDPDDGASGAKATSFVANDYVLIEDEILKVTGVEGTTVTASRAALGTTIAEHSNNDAVYNITHDPVPSRRSGSTFAMFGPKDTGLDPKLRREYEVMWEVRVKI